MTSLPARVHSCCPAPALRGRGKAEHVAALHSRLQRVLLLLREGAGLRGPVLRGPLLGGLPLVQLLAQRCEAGLLLRESRW